MKREQGIFKVKAGGRVLLGAIVLTAFLAMTGVSFAGDPANQDASGRDNANAATATQKANPDQMMLAQGGGQNGGTDLLPNRVIASAKEATLPSNREQSTGGKVFSPFIDFGAKYDAWLAMVHRTHEEEQPDWMTPIVTVTPTLQQEIRTDFSLSSYKGHGTDTYFSKGLEIIPTENTEIIFGNPTWVDKEMLNGKQASGWSDWFTTFKYRLLSSPSDAGNYILTFEFSASFGTGSPFITAGHDVVTPMLAFGKGLKTSIGEFDYQATIGPSIPTSQYSVGTVLTWNNAFQYGNRFNIAGHTVPLWPEFEVTWIDFLSGVNSGQQQVYLTPGVNVGRFQLDQHTYIVVGAGYQVAATSDRGPAIGDHQWLVTMRIPYF